MKISTEDLKPNNNKKKKKKPENQNYCEKIQFLKTKKKQWEKRANQQKITSILLQKKTSPLWISSGVECWAGNNCHLI